MGWFALAGVMTGVWFAPLAGCAIGVSSMDVFNWLVPLALLFPILWVTRVVIVARMLAGLRYGRDTVEVLPREALPPHARESFEPVLAQLREHGFEERQVWRLRSGNGRDFDWLGVEAAHAQEPVRAVLRPRLDAESTGQTWISLRTLLTDGRELVTRNYGEVESLPPPRGLEVEDVERGSVANVVARHRARVAKSAASGVVLDAAAATAREQALGDAWLEEFRQSGKAVVEPDGRLRHRFGAALRDAVRIIKAEGKRKKAEKESAAAAPVTPAALSAAAQAEFDWEMYRHLGALQRGRMAWLPKTLLMLGSLALFGLMLRWQMSPWLAAVLIVALVFHEAGHLLGMWLFGHRDTQLLFLPFFGGAAVSMDQRVLKPWQHLVIVFLGPLPGLFVGMAMFAFADADTPLLREAAMIVIVLNAFNLLPVLPLDGGQIVDKAFTARFPALRAIFLAGSGVALVAIALLLDGGILLLVLGAFMLLRLPIEWRAARMIGSLRREIPADADEETAVRALLPRLRDPAWKKLSGAQRLAQARVHQEALRRPRPGWGTMLFAVAGYASPLWLGLPVTWTALIARNAKEVEAAEMRAAAAGLTRPPAPPPGPRIPEEQNAAVPLAEAVTRINRRITTMRPGPNPGENAGEADSAEMVVLLREAARRPDVNWAPLQAALATHGHFRPLMQAMHRLVAEADKHVRFRAPAEALAIAMDGLRLEQTLRALPQWTWSEHQSARRQLWNAVEAAIAAGGLVAEPLLVTLEAAADEPSWLAYARSAMVRERIETLELLRGNGTADVLGEHADQSKLLKVLALIDPSRGETRTQAVDYAIRLRAALAALRGETWTIPAVKPKPKDGGEDDAATASFDALQFELNGLGDDAARLRQARVALAVLRARAKTGTWPGGFGDLAAFGVTTIPRHPVTGVELQWRREAGAEVLAFVPAQRFGKEPGPEILWRLPERK
jgi:Zn-dependent protease